MQPAPPLSQIVLRLILTCVAAGLIGADRSERGRAAGLRTTMLVGLAAAVAMIQADLLLGERGKAPDSFVVLDLMRLPLGILSGMGFIGAAAVFRRDDLVIGVTTAATLWFVTVMGLCFGGGQIALGLISFAISMTILVAMKRIEARLPREHRAILRMSVAPDGPTDPALQTRLRSAGLAVSKWSVAFAREHRHRVVRCEIHWRTAPDDVQLPGVVAELARDPGVHEAEWQA